MVDRLGRNRNLFRIYIKCCIYLILIYHPVLAMVCWLSFNSLKYVVHWILVFEEHFLKHVPCLVMYHNDHWKDTLTISGIKICERMVVSKIWILKLICLKNWSEIVYFHVENTLFLNGFNLIKYGVCEAVLSSEYCLST